MSYPDLWDVVILVGVPLAVISLVFALVYLSGGSAKRYRPGRPYNFAPVWFVSESGALPATPRESQFVSESGGDDMHRRRPTAGGTGGASDQW